MSAAAFRQTNYPGMYECLRCYRLTKNPEAHGAWHAETAKKRTRARRAERAKDREKRRQVGTDE